MKIKSASLLVMPLGKALSGIAPAWCCRQMIGNSLVDKLLLEKFSFCVESVEELKRFLQPDQDSSGVVVCIYAKLLAAGKPLLKNPLPITVSRKQIYDTIAGNCLKSKGKKNQCHLCDDVEKTEWIECTRCSQWMHCSCAGIALSEGHKYDNFTCPPTIHSVSE